MGIKIWLSCYLAVWPWPVQGFSGFPSSQLQSWEDSDNLGHGAGWVYVLLTQAGNNWGKRVLTEKIPPQDCPLGKSMMQFFSD